MTTHKLIRCLFIYAFVGEARLTVKRKKVLDCVRSSLLLFCHVRKAVSTENKLAGNQSKRFVDLFAEIIVLLHFTSNSQCTF